jgi:hypothetical protein
MHAITDRGRPYRPGLAGSDQLSIVVVATSGYTGPVVRLRLMRRSFRAS